MVCGRVTGVAPTYCLPLSAGLEPHTKCGQAVVIVIDYCVYGCYVMLQVMGVCDDVVVNVYSTETLFLTAATTTTTTTTTTPPQPTMITTTAAAAAQTTAAMHQ